MKTSVRIARLAAMIFMTHHQHSRWLDEDTAVGQPVMGWSPRNAGIVTIDWGIVE